MLPSQFTLQEERDMSHYAVARKNDVTDTFPEVRHRQRSERLAILSVRARDGLHLAVGREEALVAARRAPIFSSKYSLVRRDPARRVADIILRIFEGPLRLYR